MANYTGNPSSNPFDHAFEMLGQAPEITTEKVNAEALEKLTQALTSRAGERGRMILLRSPRAGFGKTHLLMRLHQRVAHTHELFHWSLAKVNTSMLSLCWMLCCGGFHVCFLPVVG